MEITKKNIFNHILEFNKVAIELINDFCVALEVEDIRHWFREKLSRNGDFMSKNFGEIHYRFHGKGCEFIVNNNILDFNLFPVCEKCVTISPSDLWRYLQSRGAIQLDPVNDVKQQLLTILRILESEGLLRNVHAQSGDKLFFEFILND